MSFSKDYKNLAEVVVDKFRDENYSKYIEYKNYCLNASKEEFNGRLKNRAENLALIDKERYEFYNSLSEQQLESLDKLILNTYDDVAFNVLREVEENLEESKSIGLTINGKPIEVISKEFWSGTCFGEYFLWLEQQSKFGKYQH